MTSSSTLTVPSTLGFVRITAVERGISGITFVESEEPSSDVPAFLAQCGRQLQEYFAGERKTFDSLPLVFHATDFQRQVWESAMEIPYGECRTYAGLAEAIGSPNAARAVGTALSRNTLMIIVPCHRILPADAHAGVGGFAGGPWRKEWLLKHENPRVAFAAKMTDA